MKKFISLLLSIAMIFLCFTTGISAADTNIAATEISAFNLSFNDSVYIKIYAWDIPDAEVKLLVWNEAQENYTIGTEDALLEPVGSQTVSGKKNQVFDYNGLAAKQMVDTVYFRAYARVDGKVVYSAVKKYSILQYVYNKLGKTGTATEDENLKTLLTDMLTYGASAQAYFNYHTDRLATSAFYQVKVVGGLLADGCDNGLYLPGDKVTLTARQTNADGADFSHWKNSAGTKVSETASFELTVTGNNETYTAVYGNTFSADLHNSDISASDAPAFIEKESRKDSILVVSPEALSHEDAEAFSATSTKAGVTTEISAFNLSFNDSVYIKIYAWDIEGSDVKMLVWNEAQENYTIGTEDALLKPVGSQTVSGKKNQVFDYNGLAAKQMANTVYFRAYAEVDGEVVYSAVKKYSILQYVYNKLGKTGTATEDENLKTLLTDMLTYGASAQAYFQYNTDRPATSAFYQVKVVGGLLSDDCDNGLYLPGDTVKLTASEKNTDGEAFSYWKNSAGTKVSETTSFELTVTAKNETYTAVYAKNEETPDEPNIVDSGVCGESLTWTLDNTGKMTISGTGAMWNFRDDVYRCPWENRKAEITSVVFTDGVTYIGSDSFYRCSNLETVIFSDSITSIGHFAFLGCQALGNFTLPNQLCVIGQQAFDSTAITSVTIPGTVYFVDAGVFGNCSNLTSVYFENGNSSMYIMSDAPFSNCKALEEIRVDPDHAHLRTVEGVLYLGTTLMQYPTGKKETAYKIPIGTTKIHPFAFENNPYLQQLTITDSVTGICDFAFRGCTGLTSITIPNSVTSIGREAFRGCTGLTSITIPNSVTSIGKYAFSDCRSLTSIEISDSVTSIGNFAFSGCTSLASITVDKENPVYHSAGNCVIETSSNTLVAGCKNSIIPSDGSVTSIGNYAFSNCSSLTSITIPNSVTSIGDGAFQSCWSLTSITIPNSVTSIGNSAFSGCSSLKSIEIPNSVTSIGDEAFYHCYSLTSITIPNSVTSIGEYAFYSCSSLTSITIPTGVTSIGAQAFRYCSSLTSVTIGNSVTSIGDRAFADCSSLTSILFHGTKEEWDVISKSNSWDNNTGDYVIIFTAGELIPSEGLQYSYLSDSDSYSVSGIGSCTDTDLVIPSTYNDKPVTSIGDSAFKYCTNIRRITLPNSVAGIGKDALHGCKNLTSITIPDSVTSIGDSAFWNCTSLTSVTIPTGVTSIGNFAFSGCTSLASITVDKENPVYHSAGNCLIETSSNTLVAGCQNSIIPSDGSVTSIGNYAFSNCSSLTSITIPNSVTSIGDGAFQSCWNLTSITIPTGVTSIGNSAFSGCGSLTSITIPNGVTSIGKAAFYGCDSLTSITIPTGVTSIGDVAFYGCTSLTSITIPTGVTSIGAQAFGYCSSLTSVTIGNSVTSIGDRAFADCSSLTSITVDKENTVYHSMNHCLIETATKTLILGCKSSKIPADGSVTSIGDIAFRYCSSITSITIPNSVTSIGDVAFYKCSSLTSVTIPNSVTSIGNSAFASCTSLSTITFHGTKVEWKNKIRKGSRWNDNTGDYEIIFTEGEGESEGLQYTYLSDSDSYFVSGIGSCTDTYVVIPSTYNGKSVTSIDNSAFYECRNLTSITFPNSVTSIGDSAFRYCTSLTSIIFHGTKEEWNAIRKGSRWNDNTGDYEIIFTEDELLQREELKYTYLSDSDSYSVSGIGSCTDTDVVIPSIYKYKSVTSIGDYAFSNCSTLTSITIPNSVTSIGASAFSGCTSLTSIEIPTGVTSIGGGAFSGCTSLTSIEIPTGVTSIGNYAFSDCSSLTSITIPNSVTSIGYLAFSSCTSLASITIPNSVTSIVDYAFRGCSSLKSIEIPTGVTSIGRYAFAYCSSLTSIEIPDSVTSIGDLAFDGCKNLTSVKIGNSVTSIGYSAFNGCSNLTSITIPNSVTSIGRYAFAYCSSLTSIEIPDSVTSIGDGAFRGCTSITSITIPNSVTSIGDDAFAYCYSLTSITIPTGVTSIGDDAFAYCGNLTSITMPTGVTSIGNSAFEWCMSLKSIDIPDSMTSIGDSAFLGCSILTSITIPNSVTSIGDGAFSGCSGLTSITVDKENTAYHSVDHCLIETATKILIAGCNNSIIPTDGSVTSISNGAFLNCSSITSITIPTGVTSIGSYAFSNCSSLTSIEIPDSVTSIGNDAFYGCKNIRRITIPDSVTSIGDYTFSNCASLTSIEIPDSVTSIGDRAFCYCTNLTSITFQGTKEEWNKISKGNWWNDNTGVYTIHCTDGDISK